MCWQKLLGIALFATPFVVMTVLVAKDAGWRFVVGLWLGLALVAGTFALGAHLVMDFC